MYNRTLKFYSGDPNLSVQYVKKVLYLMGNIKEFEVFKSEKDSPYKDANSNHAYTLILKDHKDNELWLSNASCGSESSGSSATIKILKIFGILNDFEITKKDYINEVNLVPVHRLNLLVSTPSHINKNNSHHFWISTTFQYASQLLKTKEILSCFGLCSIAKQKDIAIPPSLLKYEPEKKCNPDKDKKYDEFAINNEYVFFMQYEDTNIDFLKNIIVDIIIKNSGDFEILDI